MDISLDPTGGEIQVPTARRTPRGTRGPVGPVPARQETSLDRVLAGEGVTTQREIRIGATKVRSRAARGVPLRTEREQPGIEVRVPAPPPGMEQFVIYKDESDVITWHFSEAPPAPVPGRPDTRTVRRTAERTYVLPLRVPGSTSPRHTRSLWGVIGQKVIKVLVFPIAEALVGKAAGALAARWEGKRRVTAIRTLGPSDFHQPTAPAPNWDKLAGGRGLLVVHGTLTQANIEFTRVPSDFVAWLDQAYGGRVFAFDHFTLSQDPVQNVGWFLAQIPAGTALDLDVVCISRGGLVTRELMRQGAGRTR